MFSSACRSVGRGVMFLLFVGMILLAGCKHQADPEAGVGVDVYVPILKKEDFGAYGFVSGLRSLQFSGGNLFASDSDNSRILRLSPQLEVLGQIGNRGNGPGEFQLADLIYVVDDLEIHRDRKSTRLNSSH